ncbi:cyclic nucleotide-degrading phosphodiesterase [Mycobacterium sp.]|uniref:cyclic nucleotide-degrading phosphodiesterase n=1 Tax=Mycobacterium sp. TaxID=1785 RepID=UPI003A88824F
MRCCVPHCSAGHGTVEFVRLTVLGCSGSVTGPDSPASGYLLEAPDTVPLVIDFGGGVLGALQRYVDPGAVHVLLSHLHADHCLDLPGLFVWRRYHPTARPTGKATIYGPSDTWSRLGAASSPHGGEIDDCCDIFDVHHWADGEPVTIGALTVVPRAVQHPTESFGMRFTDPSGATLVYSGDTAECDQLVDLARGADVFLCEASWTHSPDNPPALHLSGTEAGRAAAAAGVRELALTHIPPWTSREDVLREAKAEFDGPVRAVVPGETFEIRCA